MSYHPSHRGRSRMDRDRDYADHDDYGGAAHDSYHHHHQQPPARDMYSTHHTVHYSPREPRDMYRSDHDARHDPRDLDYHSPHSRRTLNAI